MKKLLVLLTLLGCKTTARERSLLMACEEHCSAKGSYCMMVQDSERSIQRGGQGQIEEFKMYLAKPVYWCKIDQDNLEKWLRQQYEQEMKMSTTINSHK